MTRQRLVVTGLNGQVVTALIERGALRPDMEIIAIGRPDLDLAQPESVAAAIEAARPDLVVSAAAHTAVDQAESEEELATRMNGTSAGEIAKAAAKLGVPIIHISTDYVFDGSKSTPYREDDPVAPLGAYGRSKLAGELAVRNATDNHAILRTAWVYSPFGKNFLKTMLRLAESRDGLSVVNDQIGNPTSALDIADGILAIAANLSSDKAAGLRGTFHMTAQGEASWADFAEEIFSCAQSKGAGFAAVTGIPSSAYPTPARRPANSRLDCTSLEKVHGVILPPWQASTASTVERLVSKASA
ncbi:dTDP-4-dehydrorhamnose reductase [Pararhizobium antarcticum]|uniref:dTDP-4-dehydrorhamnose reductase n=1 Tax=Pararhizobium antarcticum TaxID=1798805 RepID=A0A657LQH2_9HYPH|nr:dTDP-4-dehydrorhamnose reductase [Pararhizobium antarcticum]OJF95286.1 dTDP-4-dehydrorhamnose reductase [Pararhizobium antarcticum]OJF96350.1 dTDP-4-dehydrorhamnose reductase [Rhizobium sp. 58]